MQVFIGYICLDLGDMAYEKKVFANNFQVKKMLL